MAVIPRFGAIILCGGQSRRMGFSKALLPFGKKTMIENAIHILDQIASEIVVVASPDQILPEIKSEIRIVRDPIAYQGPLTGMQSGLRHISDQIDSVFITATDSPLLKPELIHHLSNQSENFDLVMPFDGTYYYPLTSVYKVKLVLEKVDQLIREDRHRPFFLMEELRSKTIHVNELKEFDPNLDSFRNINTPVDYRNILRISSMTIPEEFHAPAVNVEFYGVPRLISKVANATLEAENLVELISELSRNFPELKGPVIVNETLHPAYRFMRGTSEFLMDLQTPLVANDKILILAVDAGG